MAHVAEVKDKQQGEQLGEPRVPAIVALLQAVRSDENVVGVIDRWVHYH